MAGAVEMAEMGALAGWVDRVDMVGMQPIPVPGAAQKAVLADTVGLGVMEEAVLAAPEDSAMLFLSSTSIQTPPGFPVTTISMRASLAWAEGVVEEALAPMMVQMVQTVVMPTRIGSCDIGQR